MRLTIICLSRVIGNLALQIGRDGLVQIDVENSSRRPLSQIGILQ
jgi:hypothetical protein